MPQSGPVHITLVAGGAAQPVENPGFKSSASRRATRSTRPRTGAAPTVLESAHAADLAWHRAAAAGPARWMEWIGINLRRSGIALLSRLPHEDAIKLAWLVAAGKMSWPDVNAALDATIKRAISEKLEGMQQSRPGSCDAHLAYDAWQDARSNAEHEIWARYHAQCDAFFADESDLSGAGLHAIEQVLHTERILDDFRIARDDALAELDKRLGPPPTLPASSRPYIAIPRFRLTPGEIELTSRLHAMGFAASAEMKEVIGVLADEIAQRIMQVVQAE